MAGQAYNINADTVAGAIVAELGAEKIIYLTDVHGLLADVDDPSSLISRIAANELQEMIDNGTVTGGMIPKIAALDAVERGVRSVPTSRRPHAPRPPARALHRRRHRNHDRARRGASV